MPPVSSQDTLQYFARNWPAAHAIIFEHRHPNATPLFHDTIIDDWHSGHERVETLAFRGASKSTRAEEVLALRAAYALHKNILIIGASADRAIDRLRAIKHEFETNETLEALFGSLIGEVWQESKIVLSNGVVIQALGREQALRGVKHNDVRPDFLFIDDLEDADSVRTPAARRKLSSWVYKELYPALAPGALIRVAATPLDPEAWAVQNANDPGWLSRTFPIETIHTDGHRIATWPARFPLKWIDHKRAEYFRTGHSIEWAQEYMCQAIDPATRCFTREMIRVEPHVRSWHSVLVAYDPARTVHATSAATGKAVGSWVGHRLIIWEATAKLWRPDEITEDIFATDARYTPTVIGVEKDGLEEFLMQPLRAAMTQRGTLLPLKPLKAPKGKLDFISSLQPFFKAGEVIFAGEQEDFQEAIDQMLGFPSGRIDFPNALAYLLTLRPGLPIFDGFCHRHVFDELRPMARTALFLALNSGNGVTTAVLVEHVSGAINVVADWLCEGDPGAALPAILTGASLEAGRSFAIYAPRQHFDYDILGMRAAARRCAVELRRGGEIPKGREELRHLLDHEVRGVSALRISTKASWTLRAFSGGYARKLNHDMPEENVYRTLMEGLEAFAACLGVARREDDPDVVYDTSGGRRYITARADARSGDDASSWQTKLDGGRG